MKKFAPLLLLALVVCGVYAPVFRNGFVWDDTALILRDPLIRSWRLIPEGFQHFLFTDATASNFYRPIQRLTYTAEYAAFGFNAAPFHVTSVLCHLAAAVALLCFAREFLRACGVEERTRNVAALIVALVWAIHPVHSSAVAYISGRADPLAATFGFSALCVGLISLRSGGTRAWALSGAGAVLFLLSALSKEAGLIFLALWVALVLMHATAKVRLRAVCLIPVVLVCYLSLRLPANQVPPPDSPPTPALVRPILGARAVAEYAALLVLPVTLQMERDVETHPSGFGSASIAGAARLELQTVAGLLVAAGFLYWLARERKRDRAVFLALVLSGISYLPVSGFVSLNATVAEHWLYVPSAFLLLAATITAHRFFSNTDRAKL
ncbi:MAG TPA: hypothetical protein VF683_11545, partial [Chthoniobacterales bacterium]